MKTKLIHAFIIGVLISIVLSGMFLFGIFETWNTSLSDNLFTTRESREDIVIIGIDDKSLSQIGRWPWDRAVHAELLNKLNENSPKIIGFDVSFFEPTTPFSDNKLTEAITDNVVLASEIVNSKRLDPLEIFSTNSAITNTIADSDGITREIPNDSFASKITNTNTEKFRMNYVGPPNTFATYSYIDILDGTVSAEIFSEKIVLIGATSPGLQDTQMTPVSNGTPMAGVEIHANAIQTILDEDFLTRESKTLTVFSIFIIALLSILLIKIGALFSVAISIILIIAYLLFAISSFDSGTIRNLIYPPLTIFITLIANIVFKYFTEIREKLKIKRVFSFYLSKPVLEQVLAHPEKLKLGGEKREITLLFSDIKGFTPMSEKMDPEELTVLLNKYLTRMTDIVHKYDGVLDKYIGDAVMAFWNEPIAQKDHALLACKVALEMMEEMKNFDFDIRIGINTGEAVVGNMGSNERLDYTAVGDTVNLAARLEGANKEFDTNIMISEHTYELVKDKVKVKKLGSIKVKGKSKATKVYELVS